MTTLICVRHAETVWNLERRYQGFLDAPLSETGLKQALALGKRLGRWQFSHLYSSDLGRALRTAEIIASYKGCEIRTDSRLRERNHGIFEGLTTEQIRRKYPVEFERYLNSPDYTIPDGESAKQKYNRNVSCFEEIVSNKNGDSVVIVSHGGVLDSLIGYVLQIPLTEPRRYSIKNASISVVVHQNNHWRLETWGDVGHLENTNALDA